MLGEIGGLLVDIHGQGQHLSCSMCAATPSARPFADSPRSGRLWPNKWPRCAGCGSSWPACATTPARLPAGSTLLGYQVEEIDVAGLTPGEDETLEQERRRLANAEALAGQSSAIFRLLVEGDGELPAVHGSDRRGRGAAGKTQPSRPDAGRPGRAGARSSERLGDLARAVAAIRRQRLARSAAAGRGGGTPGADFPAQT